MAYTKIIHGVITPEMNLQIHEQSVWLRIGQAIEDIKTGDVLEMNSETGKIRKATK